MLYNGYGEHNIQGIGDKHIPLIHNVGNSDDVIGVSDKATDTLFLLFNTETGKKHLIDVGVDPSVVAELRHLGLSSIANLVASIKLAKYHGYGSNDVVVTVATDGMEMYTSEMEKFITRDHQGEFDSLAASAAHARFLQGADTEHVMELGEIGRRRIFNLGYYTWVEQQGVPFDDFEIRRDQTFWQRLHRLTGQWDGMIDEFNARTGATVL